MRTTTLPEMLQVLSRNYNHRTEIVRLFEFGKVYFPKALPVSELPEERLMITLGMYGETDFYDIKGNVEALIDAIGIKDCEFEPLKDNPSFHPGKTALLLVNGKNVGVVGEVHPMVVENYEIDTRVFVAILDFELLLEGANLVPTYKPLPKYPAVTRDIAMLVSDDILVKQIDDIIKKCGGKLLEQLKLFDVYKGKQIPEGMKSVAYSITFRATDRTLTDDEINKVFNKILSSLKDNLGAVLR
jgi:phenylalanyl-tRNA synthetase beta chain